MAKAAVTAIPTVSLDARIVEILERVGGQVSERELRYQLKRRGGVPRDLLDSLADLEQAGLVVSELYFETTAPNVNGSRA